MVAIIKADGLYVYSNERLLWRLQLRDWGPLTEFDWSMQFSPDGRTIVAKTTRFGGPMGKLPIEQAADYPVFDYVAINLDTGRSIRVTGTPQYGSARREWMSGTGRYWIMFDATGSRFRTYTSQAGILSLYRLPEMREVLRRRVSTFYGGFWLPGDRFVYRVASGRKCDLSRDPFILLDASSRRLTHIVAARGLSLLRRIYPFLAWIRHPHTWNGVLPNEKFSYGIVSKFASPHVVEDLPYRLDLKTGRRLKMGSEAVNYHDLSPDGNWLLTKTQLDGLVWLYLPDNRVHSVPSVQQLLSASVRTIITHVQIAGTREPQQRAGSYGGLYEMVGVH